MQENKTVQITDEISYIELEDVRLLMYSPEEGFDVRATYCFRLETETKYVKRKFYGRSVEVPKKTVQLHAAGFLNGVLWDIDNIKKTKLGGHVLYCPRFWVIRLKEITKEDILAVIAELPIKYKPS